MFSALQLAKKRSAHRPEKLASASPAGVPLLYLRDSVTGREFLVDTGAAVSVFPHQSSLHSSGPPLVAADGRPIASWGKCRLNVCFSGRKFAHDFLLAGVTVPILGLDFLRDNVLLVDTAGSRVLTPAGGELSAHSTSGFSTVCPKSVNTLSQTVKLVLSSFPAVFQESADTWPSATHDVQHSIETTGRPVFAKARLLDTEKGTLPRKSLRTLKG